MYAFARVRVSTDEIVPVLQALEVELETMLPGLEALADDRGIGLDDVRLAGRRQSGRADDDVTVRSKITPETRSAKLTRAISERFGHAIVDADHESIAFDPDLVTLDDLRRLVAGTE